MKKNCHGCVPLSVQLECARKKQRCRGASQARKLVGPIYVRVFGEILLALMQLSTAQFNRNTLLDLLVTGMQEVYGNEFVHSIVPPTFSLNAPQ